MDVIVLISTIREDADDFIKVLAEKSPGDFAVVDVEALRLQHLDGFAARFGAPNYITGFRPVQVQIEQEAAAAGGRDWLLDLVQKKVEEVRFGHVTTFVVGAWADPFPYWACRQKHIRLFLGRTATEAKPNAAGIIPFDLNGHSEDQALRWLDLADFKGSIDSRALNESLRRVAESYYGRPAKLATALEEVMSATSETGSEAY